MVFAGTYSWGKTCTQFLLLSLCILNTARNLYQTFRNKTF